MTFPARVFFARLAAAYLALSFFFFFLFPSLWPRAVAHMLPAALRLTQRPFTVREVTVDENWLILHATSTVLDRFTRDNLTGPPFAFEARLRLRAANVYPVIVLSLLCAWPLFPSGRSRAGIILAALPLLLFLTLADVYAQSLWSHAQCLNGAFSAAGVPVTPANLAAFHGLERQAARLTRVQSFLSAGGRPFLALLVFLLFLAPSFLVRPDNISGGRGIL